MTFDYIIASQRLPIKIEDNKWIRSDGGLVSAISGSGMVRNALWVGLLPEVSLTESDISELNKKNFQAIECEGIEYNYFYNGFSNDFLWPLFHVMNDEPMSKFQRIKSYYYYKRVNKRFLERIDQISNEETPIWVQDYHLMLLPQLLKRKHPKRPVGFFLHIPWPPLEQIQNYPELKELVEALCQSDLIGFHTESYRDNFLSAVGYFSHDSLNSDLVEVIKRKTKVTPIGINPSNFSFSRKNSIHLDNSPKKIIGVDRFDYSKGIDFKLKVIDRLLELRPDLVGKVELEQLLIPSRASISKYKSYQDKVLSLAKEINKKWEIQDWRPINIIVGRLNRTQLKKFYSNGDICLITSLADGMNLVALEYSMVQKSSNFGTLVLSNKAGCSKYLKGCLGFCANNLEDAVNTLYTALYLPYEVRKHKLQKSVKWIEKNTSNKWAQDNLKELGVSEHIPERKKAA